MVETDTQILRVLDVDLGGDQPEEAPVRDRLTGMLSREALLGRLAQTIERAAAQPRSGFALLYLDLDRFKLVNHAYGHEAGDQLLRQVGERVRTTSRATDAVLPATRGNAAARLGGDEFVVVLEQLSRPEEALAVAERLLAALTGDYWIQGTRALADPEWLANFGLERERMTTRARAGRMTGQRSAVGVQCAQTVPTFHPFPR